MRMPVFRRTKRWLVLLSCLLLSSILFAACGENSPSILNAQGQVAHYEGFLFWVILITASIIFLVVEGLLLWFIIRYRSRPDAPNPRQIHGNTTFEILWTAIPTVGLLIVLFFTIRGLIQVSPDSEPSDPHKVTVTAIGHQWWWEFHYNDYNITTADVMHIPADTVIHVNLFSNNVIHSFWVPQLTGKTDLIPGHANTKWFKADPGAVNQTFTGICAEYCGDQHGNMRFEVHVDSADSFQSWVSTQLQHAAKPAAGSLAEQGLNVFTGAGACSGCHGIVGVGTTTGYVDTSKVCDDSKGGTSGTNCPVGPNLTHFGGRDLIAGGVLENNKSECTVDKMQDTATFMKNCNLARWLYDPGSIKPGNDMASSIQRGQLTTDQIKELVAYLESLQ